MAASTSTDPTQAATGWRLANLSLARARGRASRLERAPASASGAPARRAMSPEACEQWRRTRQTTIATSVSNISVVVGRARAGAAR
mgnify:CR=1 FL=1